MSSHVADPQSVGLASTWRSDLADDILYSRATIDWLFRCDQRDQLYSNPHNCPKHSETEQNPANDAAYTDRLVGSAGGDLLWDGEAARGRYDADHQGAVVVWNGRDRAGLPEVCDD
jgi:hypothetical protein